MVKCCIHGLAFAVLVLLMSTPTALADRPLGIDISSYQGTITPAQWAQVYASGRVFAWTKATEGTGYVDDPYMTNNMLNGREAGLYMGVYHFARPDLNSATAEANYFVSVAGQYVTGGYLRPALDLEVGYTMDPTVLSNWVNTWMNTVQAQTGVEPILYTNDDLPLNSTVANRILWMADYSNPTGYQTSSPNLGIFTTWTFWQYYSQGSVPGIYGNVDVDVFNGTLAQLQTYVIPGTYQPPYVVESRSGGKHYSNYSETGTWSDGSSKSTASLCTSGIGHRWCTISSAAATAVFRFTPTVTGTYEIFTTNCTTSNSGNPLVHKVTHAAGQTNVNVCQNTTCSPNAVNVWYSLGQYTLNANTQYSVTLDGSTGAGSAPSTNAAGRSDAIKWSFVATSGGPTITQQPAAQSICSGSNASFSVAASGQGTLTYQWQKNSVNITNGGHFSGCTTATLTITGGNSSDIGSYGCAVTDSTGTTYSSTAALTLKTATAITTQPQNQSVAAGGTATFTVAAAGDGTLSYQWQKNGANVTNGGHYSNCTTATLTISSVDSNDVANYACVVTGGCGSATSNQASLTLQTVQTIVTDNFDSYASQSAFQTAWPATATSLVLSTNAYYSSPKSLYAASGSTGYQNKKTFTETYGTDANPLTLQFRLYDGGGASAYQWVELRDYSPSTKQLIQFGIYSGQSSTYYSARVTYSPGNNWATTSVARSTGWHLFKVVFKSTTCDFYIDGVLASANRAYASTQGSVSFEAVHVGSGYGSTSVSAYYDDVLLQKGQ